MDCERLDKEGGTSGGSKDDDGFFGLGRGDWVCFCGSISSFFVLIMYELTRGTSVYRKLYQKLLIKGTRGL